MNDWKSEIRMPNTQTTANQKTRQEDAITNGGNSRPYDLEERTFQFARSSRTFAKQLPRTISNIEDVKQFIRASGSIGANYIEANEARRISG